MIRSVENEQQADATLAGRMEQLVEALAEYHGAVDSGKSPNRDTFLQRFPEIAHELAGYLDGFDFVREIAPQLGGQVEDNSRPAISARAALGDFQILREIGRGGMGVVYEAEQISLGRRVALKVLPFAAMLDKQQLTRFKNEARAAATLDHPNIVAIHSVGTERGVHYYAMQLIEGQSLAQLIEELRRVRGMEFAVRNSGPVKATSAPNTDAALSRPTASPTGATKRALQGAISTLPAFDSREYYITVARLGIQASQALDHAHANGVLHRDIKPANLMIDDDGKLWITDFGLARMEAGAGMTMTGDLLGTLRYMSPEQALAKRIVVDHRSDIYSLGLTLYEMLTLRPAYVGEDRQELLRQIAFEEPQPPRQFNRHIPIDLETIVLKAIEKNPDDRYSTAQELARDLGRLLSGEPIIAKPSSLVHRLVKWSRRHVGIVWTSLAASIAIAITLLISTLFAAHWYHVADTQRQTAESASTRAEAARLKSDDDRGQAVKQRDRAMLNEYFAEIVSGQADLEKENLGRLNEKLMRHLPLGNGPDRRGWEWYYLLSQCHPEERILFGLGGPLFAAWSPDGAYISAAGMTWHAETGRCMSAIWPTRSLWMDLAWSPDATQVAWANIEAIYLWDRKADRVRVLDGHTSSVWCVAFSPDGKQLASGSMDHTVKIWDVATGATVSTLPVDGYITDVKWSPDGKLLATGAFGAVDLQVWDTSTKERVAFHDEPGHIRIRMSWHPDGKLLAVNSPRRWYTMDRSDWSVPHVHDHPGHVTSNSVGADIAWSPSGLQLAFAGSEQVVIWDTTQNAETKKLAGHLHPVNSISWSPDGHRLVTTDSLQEIRIWDLDLPLQLPTIATGGPLRKLAWENDSQTLVTVGASDNSSASWNVADGIRLRYTPGRDKDTGILSPDRRLHADRVLAEGKATVVIKDVANGAIHSVCNPQPAGDVLNFTWSPDGLKLAIQVKSGNQFRFEFWELNSESCTATWIHERESSGGRDGAARWSPDSTKVAIEGCGDLGDNGTTYWSSHLHVIDVARGARTLKRLLGNRGRFGGRIQTIAWTADGRSLAYGSTGGIVEIIEVGSGECLITLKPFNVSVSAIDWSSDGNRLAAAADDDTIKVIESRGGNDLLTLSVTDGHANHVAWSPDGKRLAAATQKGVIQIWDATRGYEYSPTGRRRGELASAFYNAASRADSETETIALQKTLECAPVELDYRLLRGDSLARLGRFDEAAREFAAAMPPQMKLALVPALRRGHALLGARDMDAYRVLRSELFTTFGTDERYSKRFSAEWLYTLTPGAMDGLEERKKHLQEMIADDKEDYIEVPLYYGAMLYRLGQYDEAKSVFTDLIKKIDRSPDSEGLYLLTRGQLFLAMTRFQLGHKIQAHNYFQEASSGRETLRQHGRHWQDLVVLDTLHRESKLLLGEVESPETN